MRENEYQTHTITTPPPGKGGSNQEAVPRHSSDPAAAVQGLAETNDSHHPKGAPAGRHQTDQGGTDEEDCHARHAVREDHCGYGTAANGEWCVVDVLGCGCGNHRIHKCMVTTQLSSSLDSSCYVTVGEKQEGLEVVSLPFRFSVLQVTKH